MLSFLYDTWEILAGISIAISVIAALVKVRNRFSNTAKPSVPVRVLVNLLFICLCAVVISSFAIGTMLTKVPSVRGKTVGDATQTLEEVGLKLILPKGLEMDDDIYNMTIIGQNYEEDDPIPKGTEITVFVDSTGIQTPSQTVTIPNVVGESENAHIVVQSIRNVLDSLRILGLSAKQEVFSSDSPVTGTIATSTVSSSTSVTGAIAAPTVSPNPPVAEMIEVPNVINMGETDAVEILMNLGLEVQVWWIAGTDESLDYYYIIDQSVPAGVTVSTGTEIQLERSGVKLGTPITVPNVIGMEQTEATIMLKNLGLEYQVWWTEENDVSAEKYYIVAQSIPADSIVSAGTLVKLELSVTKP